MPSSINPAGETIGSFYKIDLFKVHGFVRDRDGEITIFNGPGAVGTFPQSINAAGVITGNYIGNSGQHGFVRDRDGELTTFDPRGSTNTAPTSINAAGVITGSYTDASGVSHGFLRSPDHHEEQGQQRAEDGQQH
jgi:hypothetical protein